MSYWLTCTGNGTAGLAFAFESGLLADTECCSPGPQFHAVLLWAMLEALVVATCLPASWLMLLQVQCAHHCHIIELPLSVWATYADAQPDTSSLTSYACHAGRSVAS